MFTVQEVQKGSQGASVLLLQRLLRGMGYRDADKKVLERDGDFGSKTEYALKTFQKKQGLDADGIAGTQTWGAMIGL